MVFKLFIDKSRAEEVTAAVHERTALIDEIERLVLQESITDNKQIGHSELEPGIQAEGRAFRSC